MLIRGKVLKGKYFDSVTLMRVGKALTALGGVADAAVVMGTAENREILAAADLLLDDFATAGGADLLVALRCADAADGDAALARLDELLVEMKPAAAGAADFQPGSLEGALRQLPGANLVLISLAGRYAAAEAHKALENGLHVMIFSDNVPLEEEVALKQLADERGLLLMGPDCGTTIINGAPLGFANAVRRGKIGIVAASGTGLQEVSSIIHNLGEGVSQAIGTGGRDVKAVVGGRTFLAALEALAADAHTEVILLISKPPNAAVLHKIRERLRDIRKPVVTFFLGDDAPAANAPQTLEAAAYQAVARSRGKQGDDHTSVWSLRQKEYANLAREATRRLASGRRYLRGLYSGGTFCNEAQILFREQLKPLFSNLPGKGIGLLEDPLVSRGHSLIDFGEDALTVGRPHPMIDFSLRRQRLLAEAQDPDVAVILLDIVLGYGAHPDPAAELEDALRQAAMQACIICSVTGTEQDPQSRGAVEKALRKAGAFVTPTHAAACQLAGMVLGQGAK